MTTARQSWPCGGDSRGLPCSMCRLSRSEHRRSRATCRNSPQRVCSRSIRRLSRMDRRLRRGMQRIRERSRHRWSRSRGSRIWSRGRCHGHARRQRIRSTTQSQSRGTQYLLLRLFLLPLYLFESGTPVGVVVSSRGILHIG